MQLLDGDGRARHLHEGQYALLHACAACCGEDDIRAPVADGFVDALDEGSADAHAHGAAHEGEILDAHDQRHVVDSPPRVDESVLVAGLSAGGFHAVGIAL